MDTLSKKKLLSVAEEAIQTAGTLLQYYKAKVIKSFGKDIKIDADKDAHEIISKILRKTGIWILSEEDDAHDFNKDFQWIIDPLDGSLNFFRRIPICAVSIGLFENREPLLGVVYDFNREEMFSGIVGEGAWLNGKDIFVSKIREKREAIIMTGFPSYTDYSRDALEKYISLVQSFKKVRLIGSAALSLAYVASGRADAYCEKDIKIWDVAAGLALIKAAGGDYKATKTDKEGRCTVFAGNKYHLTEQA